VGVTLAVVAWGYLVYAAIDFGSSARGGQSGAWWLLAMASAGAVACLFAGLLLLARLLRLLGVIRDGGPGSTPGPGTHSDSAPRPVGGKRAAR